MITFEQRYKEILKNDLNNLTDLQHNRLLGTRKLVIGNDLNMVSRGEKEDIYVVIKTGQGLKSEIPFYDQTSIPVFVNFTVESNFTQELLSILNRYINQVNAVVFEDGNYNFKIVYNTPSILTDPYDRSYKGGSYTACTIALIGTAVFTSNNILKPADAKISINNDEIISINNIINYELSVVPTYENVLFSGDETSTKQLVSEERTYVFNILKTGNIEDRLETMLTNNLKNKYDTFTNIKLILDGDVINIQSYNLTERWETSGVAIYVLTLVA